MTLDIKGVRVSRNHLLLGAVRNGIDQSVASAMRLAVKDPSPKNLARRGKCVQCLSATHDHLVVDRGCAVLTSACSRCGLVVRWEGGPSHGCNAGEYWVRLESAS
jgi:hypothetical protein